MLQPFSWLLIGIDLTVKLIWIIILPIKLISWTTNITLNIIMLSLFIGIFALFTGYIPDNVIQDKMDIIGNKVIHFVDPHGDKIINKLQK